MREEGEDEAVAARHPAHHPQVPHLEDRRQEAAAAAAGVQVVPGTQDRQGKPSNTPT